jgi:hypothetical protein
MTKNANEDSNFEPIIKTEPEKRCEELLAEIYMDKPFTGTDVERAFCKMMLTNKQGSVGIESVLCNELGLYENKHKHGFDGKHRLTGAFVELKPNTDLSSSGTYNDVTPKKINELMNTPDNIVMFASHVPREGKLALVVMLPGKNIAAMLDEKMKAREKKILGRMNEGKKTGTRQTHSISLRAYIKKYGSTALEVIYYKSKIDGVSDKMKKALNLTSDINLMEKVRNTGCGNSLIFVTSGTNNINFASSIIDENNKYVLPTDSNADINQWYEI